MKTDLGASCGLSFGAADRLEISSLAKALLAPGRDDANLGVEQ